MNLVRMPVFALLLLMVSSVPAATQAERPPSLTAVQPAGAPDPGMRKPQPQDYVIGPDDVLHIAFWRDETLSADVVVRPDGHISLPLLRDVPALGLTPGELGTRIQDLATAYLERPNVTVIVKQINSRKVFITGEVGKPGTYQLAGPTTVLQLIAMAGGLTPFAKQERIVIMRSGPAGPVVLRFDYKRVSKMQGLGTNVILLPGDTVLVP